MKLPAPGHPHLTYCTNIHPGESWEEVRANLEHYVAAVRRRVAPARPFGVGLRLSARAAAELEEPARLEAARALLDAHGLYVFTINGFPYGDFHGTRVKDAVYLPDWLDEARLAYTDRLARLLAALLPAGDDLEGSISTVPGAFKPRVPTPAEADSIADRLLRHVATLHRLEDATGRRLALALEPEPCCYLETVAETVAFFERHLFGPPAVARLAALTGLSGPASEALLRRSLGVCFDACHMAVEFEDVRAALRRLRAAGIRVVKAQISAGLRATLEGPDDDVLEALRPFADGVYLHQVVERGPGGLRRWADLPEALAQAARDHGAREWHVHFHVPLFRERLGRFSSTQASLRELLAEVRAAPVAPHLEVETYTWEVLPDEYRREDIVTAVARELGWVLEQL